MKKSLLFLTAGCLSLILFLSGCQTVSVQADTPEGFADISESADYYSDVVPYRAISPEGVIFRVRSVDNYPEKGIDFWAETLRLHLEKSGYKPVEEPGEFTAGKNDGVYFTWAVPYNREAYIYLTGIVIAGDQVIIAETAAEHSLFSQYRDTIIHSLETVQLSE